MPPVSSLDFLRVLQWNAESFGARSVELLHFFTFSCRSYMDSEIESSLFFFQDS